MKKTTCIIFFFLGLALGASSQQIPQYTQYMFNQFSINPAIAGTKECIDTRLGYRSQWVGFDGAPQTAYANINGRIDRKKKGMFIGHHGVGGHIETDVTGPTSRTMVYAAYAYHIPISPKIKVSAGLFAGIQQYRLDVNKVTLTDFNDPIINDSRSVILYPDISPGIWLYAESYYAGLSVRQVFQNRLKNIGEESKLTNHYLLTAGKKFTQDDSEWSFIPSFLFKYTALSSPAIDLNVLAEYQDRFAVGLSYRNIDAIAAMVKVDFLEYFFLGYSFDLTTSKIRLGSSNSHEITLGIYTCPDAEPSRGACDAYY